MPNWEDWVPDLLVQFHQNVDHAQKSHKIDGRWENLYLDVEDVGSVRIPIRFARDCGKEKMGISSVILFDPLAGSSEKHPPFWLIWQNQESPPGCMIMPTMPSFQEWSIYPVK